jgi:hypothetical protein
MSLSGGWVSRCLCGVQVALLVGGDSMEEQFEALTHNPDILIGTPGRVMHHLQVRHTEPFAFEGGRGGRRACSSLRVTPWAVVADTSRLDDGSAVCFPAPAAHHDLLIGPALTVVCDAGPGAGVAAGGAGLHAGVGADGGL